MTKLRTPQCLDCAIEAEQLGDGTCPECGGILAAVVARSVTTTDELRGLPDGTLLRSGSRIRQYDGALWRIRGGMVDRVGQEREGVTPFKYFVDPLPAAIIHMPDLST